MEVSEENEEVLMPVGIDIDREVSFEEAYKNAMIAQARRS